jgi:iron(III) transport system substrate-binding protein
MRGLSRRDILKASAALPAYAFAAPARAAPPEMITPALVKAAKKEGQVVW